MSVERLAPGVNRPTPAATNFARKPPPVTKNIVAAGGVRLRAVDS
jgi:hypothetical protein